MNARSRSTLFLIEQLVVIAIFAVCASVCTSIFIDSYLMANDTRDMNHALVAAKGGAECFKAYGDPRKTAAVLGGGEDGLGNAADGVVYYDAKWRVCGAAEAAYALRLRSDSRSSKDAVSDEALPLLLCQLSVEKISGEEIIGFTVAVRRTHGGQRDE